MFLGWYSVSARDDSLTAWGAFSVVDVLLALVALLGIALALSQVIGRGPTLPVALGVITTTLALAGTLLLLYRILNQPGPNDLISVEAGAYLGLAGELRRLLRRLAVAQRRAAAPGRPAAARARAPPDPGPLLRSGACP